MVARNTKENSIVVARYPSNTKNDKWYEVRENNATKALSCNCPRWVYKQENKPRSCRHLILYAENAKLNTITLGTATY